MSLRAASHAAHCAAGPRQLPQPRSRSGIIEITVFSFHPLIFQHVNGTFETCVTRICIPYLASQTAFCCWAYWPKAHQVAMASPKCSLEPGIPLPPLPVVFHLS